MNKYYKLSLLFIIILIITGCWNYRDVNKMRFATGIAIDYDKDKDEYIITSDILSPQRKGNELGSKIFQSRGETVFDGIRDLIFKNGRRLYWGHTKIVILSESVAKEKILSVLDFISRDAEFRDDIWLLVSKEKTASAIYEIDFMDAHKIMSFHIDYSLRNAKSVSTYYSMPAWKFIKTLYAEGVSATLPVVKIRDANGGTNIVTEGTAVFKKEKLVGWLDEIETMSYLFVVGEIEGGILIVDSNKSKGPVKIGLEIFKNKTKVKPIYSDGNITMNIDIQLSVNIGEIGGDVDVISGEGRQILIKDTENLIAKQTQAVIRKVQKEYKSDIFGFSTAIKKEMPSLWKEIKPNWEDIFSSLNTKINVKVNIRGSALTSKPLKIAR